MGMSLNLSLKVDAKKYYEEIKAAMLDGLRKLADNADLEDIMSWAEEFDFYAESNTIDLHTVSSAFDDEGCFYSYFEEVAKAVPEANFSGTMSVWYDHAPSKIVYEIKKEDSSFYYGRPLPRELAEDFSANLQNALKEEGMCETDIAAVFKLLSCDLETTEYELAELASMDMDEISDLEALLALPANFENMAKILKMICELQGDLEDPVHYATCIFCEYRDIAEDFVEE